MRRQVTAITLGFFRVSLTVLKRPSGGLRKTPPDDGDSWWSGSQTPCLYERRAEVREEGEEKKEEEHEGDEKGV